MHYRKLLVECYEKVKQARERGVPIVCVDEAVFTFNTIRKRAWFCKEHNMKVSQESRQMAPLAFVAGIESNRGLVVYAIHEHSINAEKFIAFLGRLKVHMSCPELVVFLDNLSVHKTKAVKKALQDLNITPIYNIPYSPDFNGIESYFSLVKGQYKNIWMQQYIKEEPVDSATIIEQIIANLSVDSIKSCINRGFECLE